VDVICNDALDCGMVSLEDEVSVQGMIVWGFGRVQFTVVVV
jgi:hypothetical protein